MKLTIDTKHDTHEDIRKVLHILTHLLEGKEGSLDSSTGLGSETGSASEPADSSNLMSMFANPQEKKEETAPDFSSFMNLVNKKDEDKDKEPKLEFF